MTTDEVRSAHHYDDDDTDDYDDEFDDDIAVEDDVDDADHGRSAAFLQKLTTSVLRIGNHG